MSKTIMAGYKLPSSVAVVMAGGTGTRFWPLSQPHLPKQYLNLLGTKPLIVETVERIRPCVSNYEVVICSSAAQELLLREHFDAGVKLVLEPFGRNTAPCLMLSLIHLLRHGMPEDTVMVAVPADHYIANHGEFQKNIQKAISLAHETHGLVTLGIVPDSAHTGYGYIEAGERFGKDAFEVIRFVEKPTVERAREFLEKKNFYWNSGIFAWELGSLKRAFEAHLPQEWKAMTGAKDDEALSVVYAGLKAQPIDVAVLEKSDELYVIPSQFSWSDIGSWNALHELKSEKTSDTVTLSGTVASVKSHGCLVHVPSGKRVALVGVEDLIVVENADTILIAHRSQDQLVRDAVKAFEPPELTEKS